MNKKRILLLTIALMMTVTFAFAEEAKEFSGFSVPDWANGEFDTSSWGNFGDMSWDNFDMPDWDTSSWGDFNFSMPEQEGLSWGSMGDFASSFEDMQKQTEEKFNSFSQQYGSGSGLVQPSGNTPSSSMTDLQEAFENSQGTETPNMSTGNIKEMFTNLFGNKTTGTPSAYQVEKPSAPSYQGVGSSGGQVAELSKAVIAATAVKKETLGNLPIGETAAQHQFSTPSALGTYNSTTLNLSSGMRTNGSEFKSLYNSGKKGVGSGSSGTKSVYDSKSKE